MKILPTLCPIRVKRGSSKKTLILVPRRKIVDLRRLFLNEKLVRDFEVGQNVFTLTLCPIRSIAVSAFELICPLSWKYDDYHNQNWLDRLNKAGSFKTNTFLHILSTVTSAKQKSSSKEVQLPEELPMNECSRVDHFALVPAGGTLILTATLNQACVLRDVHLQQEDLNSCNEPRIVETFGRIAATVTNNRNYHHQELNDLCIFRKIYFAEV
ncbi:uncharacterized protein LOC135936302 [Cloeon dipterum]|uniref:uncharacterized protein LOC135936302 n=1 Tax=Cloeon dipterum TaxID=197152 RepID=UPI00321FB718